jgi:hypothetical protein
MGLIFYETALQLNLNHSRTERSFDSFLEVASITAIAPDSAEVRRPKPAECR